MKFKEGQKAWSSRHGWGTIVRIDPQKNQNIRFRADNMLEKVCYFDADGRWLGSDLYPTLFHKEQIFDYSEPEIPNGTLGYFWEDTWSYRAVLGSHMGLTENGLHKCRGHLPFQNFCPYPELPPHLKDKS